MAALTTLRNRSFCPEMVDRMRVAGKPGKVIVVALARKLLTVANAVIRDQKPFQRPV